MSKSGHANWHVVFVRMHPVAGTCQDFVWQVVVHHMAMVRRGAHMRRNMPHEYDTHKGNKATQHNLATQALEPLFRRLPRINPTTTAGQMAAMQRTQRRLGNPPGLSPPQSASIRFSPPQSIVCHCSPVKSNAIHFKLASAQLNPM